jgi:pleckstrin homology domain-containing family A member 1/2
MQQSHGCCFLTHLVLKTWKKRWFVLRPAHLAYYKTSAEYQLLRLLDLADVHSCTAIALKRHPNTLGLVSPVRTFYLQAESQPEVQEWVTAIEEARQNVMSTSTQTSITSPITIPAGHTSNVHVQHSVQGSAPRMPPPSSHAYVTSSDSDDGSPTPKAIIMSPHHPPMAIASSPAKTPAVPQKDPSKIVLSGYLMKCGSKRRNWRKRWFVLNGEKLVYSASHMVS